MPFIYSNYIRCPARSAAMVCPKFLRGRPRGSPETVFCDPSGSPIRVKSNATRAKKLHAERYEKTKLRNTNWRKNNKTGKGEYDKPDK